MDRLLPKDWARLVQSEFSGPSAETDIAALVAAAPSRAICAALRTADHMECLLQLVDLRVVLSVSSSTRPKLHCVRLLPPVCDAPASSSRAAKKRKIENHPLLESEIMSLLRVIWFTSHPVVWTGHGAGRLSSVYGAVTPSQAEVQEHLQSQKARWDAAVAAMQAFSAPGSPVMIVDLRDHITPERRVIFMAAALRSGCRIVCVFDTLGMAFL